MNKLHARNNRYIRKKEQLYWEIPKSHIGCLNPWSAAYIFVGQLHLMSIDFKMKSNMVSEQALTLRLCIRFRCDKRPWSTEMKQILTM